MSLGVRMDLPASSEIELSMVVPCYHTGGGIPHLVEELSKAAKSCCRKYEIILVNDGSRDETWPGIQAACAGDPHIHGINLSRNFGQQAALLAGLSASRGQRILMIDDDLQDPPGLLPEMMRLMDGGAEVVYGQRLAREGESFLRKSLTHTFYWLTNLLSDVPQPMEAADFRLLSRRALDVILSMSEQPLYLRGMIGWIGLDQVALPYRREARHAGQSNYSWGRLFRLATEGVTSTSIRPLKLGILAGGAVGVFAALLLIHILIGVFYGRPPQGWTSLMAVILGLGSVNLFVLGIIGEYLACIFLRTQGRPPFIVREQILPKN